MDAIPRVSVVIPTYGRPGKLRTALEAVLACAEPAGGREVIVVDDGSPQPVEDVLHMQDRDLRVLRQANAGPAAARNAGIATARGQFVAFTDDDTVASRNWLVDLLAVMEADPTIAGVGGRVVSTRRGFMADFVQVERMVDHGRAPDGTVRYLVTANAMFRKDALTEIGGFDVGFPTAAGEDVDLSMRLRRGGWVLAVADGAEVAHEHRTALIPLVRTALDHGRERAALVRRYPDLLGNEVPVLRRIGDRYRRCRAAGVGHLRSISYVAMYLAKSGLMVLGAAKAGRGKGGR